MTEEEIDALAIKMVRMSLTASLTAALEDKAQAERAVARNEQMNTRTWTEELRSKKDAVHVLLALGARIIVPAETE